MAAEDGRKGHPWHHRADLCFAKITDTSCLLQAGSQRTCKYFKITYMPEALAAYLSDEAYKMFPPPEAFRVWVRNMTTFEEIPYKYETFGYLPAHKHSRNGWKTLDDFNTYISTLITPIASGGGGGGGAGAGAGGGSETAEPTETAEEEFDSDVSDTEKDQDYYSSVLDKIKKRHPKWTKGSITAHMAELEKAKRLVKLTKSAYNSALANYKYMKENATLIEDTIDKAAKKRRIGD